MGHEFWPPKFGRHFSHITNLMPGDVFEADVLPTAGTWAVYCQTNDHIAGGMIGRISVAESPEDDPMVVMASPNVTRKYYLQAEEVVWDYGASTHDLTGQYAYTHGNFSASNRGPIAFEDRNGSVFMVNDVENNRIGRKYSSASSLSTTPPSPCARIGAPARRGSTWAPSGP